MAGAVIGGFLARLGGAIAPKLSQEALKKGATYTIPYIGKEISGRLLMQTIGAGGVAGTAVAGNFLLGGNSAAQQPYGAWRGSHGFPHSPYGY
jgi:hypothetical protein